MLKLSGPTVNDANLELVTTTEVRAYLGEAGQTADATRLGYVVAMVNRMAYDRMRQRMVKSTGTPYDVVLDGPYGGRELFLPYKPVVDVTSVAAGYYETTGWVDTYTYDSSEYVRDDEQGILYAVESIVWPFGKHNLRVQYQAGYTTVPSDLKGALMQWASVEYRRAAGERLDMTAQTNETGSDAYTFGTIPASADAVLARYTRKWGLF